MLRLLTPIEQVDTDLPKYQVGTRTVIGNGNEYIYLPGKASVALYDWVTYNTAAGASVGTFSFGSVTRFGAGYLNVGHVAISQGAITSNKYGWFQIAGQGWGNCGDGTSAAKGSAVYVCTGTAATVTGVQDAGQIVYSAFIAGTGLGGGTVKVNIHYPYTLGMVLV
jgi:hypothetical protein